MNSYAVNDTVQISVTFTALLVPGNPPVDPTDVTLTLTPPSGGGALVYDYAQGQVIRDGVGQYHVQYVVQSMGIWIYRWQGSGAVVAASPNGFFQGI